MRRLLALAALLTMFGLSSCQPSCGDGGYPWSPPGCQNPTGTICTGNICAYGRV